MTHESAYGLWGLVIINSLVFIIFAFSFAKPQTTRDWRSFGMFSAFIVALFVEMYGFPLTIYLLSGWLAQNYPQLDPLAHDSGHLWHTLLRMQGNPHFDILHILSSVLIFGGFWLLSAAWKVLYAAQRGGTIASTGPYARASSAISCVYPDHARLFIAVANAAHADYVSDPDLRVYTARATGGTGGARRVR